MIELGSESDISCRELGSDSCVPIYNQTECVMRAWKNKNSIMYNLLITSKEPAVLR
jgi:hypothetical protein